MTHWSYVAIRICEPYAFPHAFSPGALFNISASHFTADRMGQILKMYIVKKKRAYREMYSCRS